MLSWISASVNTPFSISNASIALTLAASGLVALPVTAAWSWSLPWLISLLPAPASARRRRRRAARLRDPRSRTRALPGGSRPCRGRAPAPRRGRRQGLPGSGSSRARPRCALACPSGSQACGRGQAWRRGAPGRRRRVRSAPSSALPAALDLRCPPVDLNLGEDALLDEELLGGRGPALVVGKVAVVRE